MSTFRFNNIQRNSEHDVQIALATHSLIRAKKVISVPTKQLRTISSFLESEYQLSIPADILQIMIRPSKIKNLCFIEFTSVESFNEILADAMLALINTFYFGPENKEPLVNKKLTIEKINILILQNFEDLHNANDILLEHVKKSLPLKKETVSKVRDNLEETYGLSVPNDILEVIISNANLEEQCKKLASSKDDFEKRVGLILNNECMTFYFGKECVHSCYSHGINVSTDFIKSTMSITNSLMHQLQNETIDVTDELNIINLNDVAA